MCLETWGMGPIVDNKPEQVQFSDILYIQVKVHSGQIK